MSQVSYGTITITDTNDIESITVEYNRNQSPSDAPSATDSGWSTTRPDWAQGYYIWQRTRVHKSGTTADKDVIGTAVCITGSTGSSGTSVTISSIKYAVSTTESQPADSSFTYTSVPTVAEGSWLWTLITYSNGSKAYMKSKQGVSGDSITVSKVEYQSGTSPTSAPTGTWQTSIPTVAEGNYLWTKTTYSDGNYTYSVAKQGKSGTSVSISSTSTTYQVSTSPTTTPTGEWKTTVQSTTTGQYLWTRTIVTYSDGNSTTSYSVAAHGATGTSISISSIKYAVSSTDSQPADSSFTYTSVPTVNEGQWLWTLTTYSNGSKMYTKSKQGKSGNDGRSLTATETRYVNVASGTTQSQIEALADNAWVKDVPAYDSTKPDYWGRIKNTYDKAPINTYIYYKDNAISESLYNAAIANSIAQQTIEDSQGAMSQAASAVKEVKRIWFAKATSDPPEDPPETGVTTGDASTHNSWSIVKPAENPSYPYYFYCDQTCTNGGVYSHSEILLEADPYTVNALNVRTKNFFHGKDSTYDGWFASGRSTNEGLNESDATTYYYNARVGATNITLGYNKTPVIDLDGRSGAINIYRLPTINSSTGLVTTAGSLGAKLNASTLTFYNASGTATSTFGDSIALASNGASITIGSTGTGKYNTYINAQGLYLQTGTTPYATLNSNGLVLSKGGVNAGTSNTNNYVYISSENGPRIAINGYTPPDPTAQATLNAPQWREIIGTKFGVLSDGTLYANEAHISGAITAASLTIGSNATINDTSGLIRNDAIEIGGRNLLRGTKDYKGATNINPPTVSINEENEIFYVSIKPSSVGWTNVMFLPAFPFSDIDGKTIVVSCDVRLVDDISSPTSTDFYLTLQALTTATSTGRVGNKDHAYNSSILTKGKWVRLSYTLEVDKNNWSVSSGYSRDDFLYCSLAIYNHTAAQIDFKCAQVEIGNKATDWTPAPEDVTAYTDEVAQEEASKVISVKEVSGNIVHVEDASEYPALSLKVHITSKQSGTGTPSPDNVRPISGWESVSVDVTGVNVWDEEWELGAFNENSGEPIANTTTIRSKEYIQVLPNTSYYFYNGGTDVFARVVFYDSSKNVISVRNNVIHNGSVFTTPSNTHYMRFNMASTYGATYNHDISINYPSTDHDYHAYTGTTTTTDLGRTVYGGTIDVVSGVLTVTKVGVDLGSLTWSKYGNYTDKDRYVTTGIDSNVNNDEVNAICSIYPHLWGANGWWIGSGSGKLSIFTTYGQYSSVSAFKTAMSGQILCYPLAQPQTYTLTGQEVETLLGENNVWADAGAVDLKYASMNSDMHDLMSKSNADIEDASKVANSFLKFESGENGGLMVADLNGASDTTIGGIDTRNVLIDPDSVDIREGQNVLASFGEKTVIGEDTDGHSRIFIDPSSNQSGITNIFRVVSKNNINAHQIILDDNNLSNNVPVVIETPYWTDGIGSSSDPLTTTSRTSTPATFVIDEMDEIPDGQQFKIEVLLTTYKKSGKLSYGHPESCVIPFTKGSSETINWGLDVFSGTVLYTVKMEYTAPKTFKLTVTAELASTTSGVSYWLSISEICALYHTQQELVPVHKMHGDVYLNSGGLGRTWIGLESILNSSTGQAVYGNDADFHNMLLSYGWTHGRINDFDLKELLYDLICTVPIGTIEMYGGSTLPTGWLFCYGQPVNRSTYSALFEVIGTSFGEGDGSTTFNLPDLRGRFPLGVGNGTAAGHTNHKLNGKGGNENAIVPYHRHGLNGENAAASSANASHTHATGAGTHYMYRDTDGASSTRSAVGGSGKYTWTSGSANGFLSSTNTASASAAHGHSLVGNTAYAGSSNVPTTGANMPPYIGLRFIIYTGLNRKDSGDQIE